MNHTGVVAGLQREIHLERGCIGMLRGTMIVSYLSRLLMVAILKKEL